MPHCLYVVSVFFLSLSTVPPATSTKHTGVKAPEEVNDPDESDAPGEPNDDRMDKTCTDKQDEVSNHSSDEGNELRF